MQILNSATLKYTASVSGFINYLLFYDAVSKSDNITSDKRMINE
jgi:hypothetical protein